MKNPIKKYEIRRGIFTQYVLGIAAYKDGGESVFFTGTNAEANAKCRELDREATEPGTKWNIMSAVEVES